MRTIKKLVCFFFGHDKFFPHPNKRCWSCARCHNGPDDYDYNN
jgi:hypothetical protein